MRSLFVVALLAGPPASAQERLEAAQANFESRDYAAAEDDLRRAYAVDPDPQYVYGQAQARRFGGDCRGAKDLYERFIALGARPRAAGDARAGIADCTAVLDAVDQARAYADAGRFDDARRTLAELGPVPPSPEVLLVRADVEIAASGCEEARALIEAFEERVRGSSGATEARERLSTCGATTPAPPRPAVATPPNPAPRRDQPPPPPKWYADAAGGVLVGLGVAAAAVGGGLLGVARRDIARAPRAADEVMFEQQVQRSVRLNAAGISLLALGGALLVGGIVRYAVVGARARRAKK